MALADLIVVMNAGRIEDCGPPDRVYARPATRFAATFMGESTIIEGHVTQRDDESVLVDTRLGAISIRGQAEPNETVAISIRPERLRLEGADGLTAIGSAKVTAVVFQGGFVRVVGALGDGTAVLIKALPEAAPRVGDTIHPAAAPADLILLRS